MKNCVFCLCLIAGFSVILPGCKEQTQLVSQYRSDTEKIEVFLNFSLIDPDHFDEYVNMTSDDAVLVKKILDYNLANDKEKFSGKNDGEIKNKALLEKLLMLSNNL
jgi:hypothetical protein